VTGGDYRTRRSALTWTAGLAVSAATIAIAFITTPLLLKFLGPERFGAARAASDWFGHLTLLELGLGSALAPLLALALGRGDELTVRRTMSEGIRAFGRVALVAVLAGLMITMMITRLVPVSPGLARDLQVGCLIATAGLLLYPLAPFRPLADASQRGYALHFMAFAQSVMTTALAVLLAWQGFGITGWFAAVAAGQLLFALLILRDGRRRHPGVLKGAFSGPGDPEARAAIKRLNAPSLLFDLAGRAGLLTDNIVIALVLGPTAVVPLFLTQRLPQLAQQQLQGVGNASWAALGQLHALGRNDVFTARLLELTRLLVALGLAALVPIAAFNHAFVNLWVGSAHFGGSLVTALAAVNALLLALVSLWGWCLTGTGQVATMVPVMLVSAALNLTLSIAGAWLLGIAGPLLGTTVAITTTTLWFLPLQLHRRFGVPLGGLARAVLSPLAWGTLPALGIWWLARSVPPSRWWLLGVEAAGAAAVMLAVWWVFELDAGERRHYLDRARMVARQPKV